MDSPHFIFSSAVLPWPPDQGSKRFMLEVGRSLLSIGKVTWVSRATGGDDEARRELTQEGFQLHLDESYRDTRWLARMRRRLRSSWQARRQHVPRVQIYACTQRMQEIVREELQRDPDAIVVGAFWFEAPAVRLGRPGRRVLILSDLEYHREAERLGSDPEGRLPKRVQRLREAEKAAFRSCDALLCLTEDDRQLAQQTLAAMDDPPPVKLGVWPAVVPVPDTMPPLARRDPDEPQRWLSFGYWAADFNRDGLRRFLRETWPALVRAVERPPLLRIAGSGLTVEMRREIQAAGAEAIGWVVDIEEEIAGNDAVIVPLDYGGGLRYRMLKAQAAGRPIVCTPVAARGAGETPGEHYLQAETPAEWVRAWRTLEDPVESERLARAGYEFVREHFGPEGRAERLRQVLRETLEMEIP